MAANDDMTKKDLIENDEQSLDNKIVNISERLDKLEKDIENIFSDDKITDEEKENIVKEILQNEEFLKSAAETINKDNSKYDELINELKEQLSNSFDDKIDDKIEKNNANYNSIMLEQNLKNFKEISSLRKNQKDLENSVNDNNAKYDDIVNNVNSINEKLDTYSEEYKKEIDILNTKLEESKEEQTKFLEEEKENLTKLKEELSNNIEEKIDEKIEKNNANYNSIM
uniref:coiled-coil domain-containing protein n=1 Tax=Brachyspira hyodysenteriae TaxID=159 RepID=UPI00048045EA